MNREEIHKEWVAHPTGAIAKGAFCSVCKRFNVRNMTVQLVALNAGKILLQRRNLDPERGAWALVAGYLSWDETVEEGMRRELFEETGLSVAELDLIGVYSDPKRDKDGRQNVAILYAGEVTGEAKIDPYEVQAMEWFDLHKLPERIAFDHRQMIEDFLQKKASNRL